MTSEARRLIVEAGIAAVNHGLYREAWAIHAALPALIPDAGDRCTVEAVMLIGLGRTGSAARLIKNVPTPYAEQLAPLLAPPQAAPCGSFQCLYSQES
nr:EscG/YscG/SsaH family type III secretion system needle protein co-chaperone [Burkholderia ubonensis]